MIRSSTTSPCTLFCWIVSVGLTVWLMIRSMKPTNSPFTVSSHWMMLPLPSRRTACEVKNVSGATAGIAAGQRSEVSRSHGDHRTWFCPPADRFGIVGPPRNQPRLDAQELAGRAPRVALAVRLEAVDQLLPRDRLGKFFSKLLVVPGDLLDLRLL